MNRSRVVKYEFPDAPYATDLASFHIEAVPTILSALALKSLPYWYASREDWHQARKSLAYHAKELLMPSGADIVHSIDRVYTLLDAGLFGTERSVTGTGTDIDPYVYNPPLSQARQPTPYGIESVRYDGRVTRELLDNLTTGATNGASSDARNLRQQLDDILAAIQASGGEDGPTAEQIATIIQILGAI